MIVFFRGYNLLSTLARPEALPSPLATGAAREWAHAGAHLAMSRDLPGMNLSHRLADPGAYLRLQKGRRQALEALMAVEPDEARLERVVDLICMVVEESTWSENPKGAAFDDDQQRIAALQAAQKLYRKYEALPEREARAKLSQALARRGFGWDAIESAVDEVMG